MRYINPKDIDAKHINVLRRVVEGRGELGEGVTLTDWRDAIMVAARAIVAAADEPPPLPPLALSHAEVIDACAILRRMSHDGIPTGDAALWAAAIDAARSLSQAPPSADATPQLPPGLSSTQIETAHTIIVRAQRMMMADGGMRADAPTLRAAAVEAVGLLCAPSDRDALLVPLWCLP